MDLDCTVQMADIEQAKTLSDWPSFSEWSLDPASKEHTTIHCLPDEVLVMIMQQLSPFIRFSLGGVCRRWYNVSRNSLRNLVLLCYDGSRIFLSDDINHECLEKISTMDYNLTRTLDQEQVCQLVLRIRGHLKAFCIQYSDLSLQLWAALNSCPHLIWLELIYSTFSQSDSTSVSGPPALKVLSIRLSDFLSENALRRLLTNVPELEELYIYSKEMIGGECIVECLRGNKLRIYENNSDRFPLVSFNVLGAFHMTLETLRISITAEFLALFENNSLPVMRKLTMLSCEDFDDFDVEAPRLEEVLQNFDLFLKCAPNLLDLNFGKGEFFDDHTTDRIIPCIIKNCHNIRNLGFDEIKLIDGGSNLSLLASLQNLNTITAKYDWMTTDYDWVMKCKNIRILELNESHITDWQVLSIIRSLPKLTSLDISDCNFVSGEFLETCDNLTLRRTEKMELYPLFIWCSDLKNAIPDSLPDYFGISVNNKIVAAPKIFPKDLQEYLCGMDTISLTLLYYLKSVSIDTFIRKLIKVYF